MAREVLRLFLCVDANHRGFIVRLPRRAEAIWRAWRAETDRPVAGSGGYRVRRRNSDSCGALCGLRRVHRGRRDGGSLLQAACSARLLANLAGRQRRRVGDSVLLCVSVHRFARLRNTEHRRADSESKTALKNQKAEGRKRKAAQAAFGFCFLPSAYSPFSLSLNNTFTPRRQSSLIPIRYTGTRWWMEVAISFVVS